MGKIKEENFCIKIKINSERPDFRVFGTYFFGNDLYNYDSDGDSFIVTSKVWTELYMCCRLDSKLWFDISRESNEPLILKVTGQTEQIVNSISYFLVIETDGEIVESMESMETLISKMGDFKLRDRIELSKNSVWRKATEENPYPNLSKNV